MSIYTQLLDAAFVQRAPVLVRPTAHSAVEAARRSRGQLGKEVPPGTDRDAVPVVLAREIGYDVALLELAALLGIETDPSRFDQPRQERLRLEQALSDRGITLHAKAGSQDDALDPD
jgi:hypothetical protein